MFFSKKDKRKAQKNKELLENSLREMNEHVPRIVRNISMLKKNISSLKGDVQKVREFKEAQLAYSHALSEYKSYIAKKSSIINKALASFENSEERKDWETRYAQILKSCESLENSQQQVQDELIDPVKKKIATGYEKLEELKSLSEQICNTHFKEKAHSVIQLCEKVLKDVVKHPTDISKARSFLTHYLDALNSIITGYISLNAEEPSERITESLKRAESILDAIEHSLKNLHTRLIEMDILNFDAEISVLEKILRIDISPLK